MIKANQILKYLDLYGERCSFYIETTQKLYSVVGGILSIITILICCILFIYTSLGEFKRVSPSVSISSIQPNIYHKIKFGQEKIWIPWRIRDYSNHFVNHTNLFYPLIYNYYSIRKTIGTGFEFRVKQLNYTLCNQTSFINKSEIFYIDSSLDELYCIEMDNIDIGGDWRSDYISYIEFDLYLCKEGIDYNESNPYCTKKENITHYIGLNNSLLMSLYYPIVQFKANDSINPMTIIYKERFYHISLYTSKIERFFLQKNILKDDYGWFTSKYNETSYWGIDKFQGDSYTTGNKRDLMNEGSTSRVYSFNIYLEPTINTYVRTYKKLHIIISECVPIFHLVSFIFNMISKFCKFHTINKKFLEFLFINMKEKPDKFEKKVKELNEKSLNKIEKRIFQNNSFKKKDKNLNNNKNEKYEIYVDLSNQNNNIFYNKLQGKGQLENSLKDNSLDMFNQNKQKEILSSKSIDFKENKFVGRQTIKSYLNLNGKKEYSLPDNDKLNVKRRSVKKISLVRNVNVNIQSLFRQNQKMESKHFVYKKLFPSRYYFYVIFIKNLDLLKKTKCVSNKFSKTYLFLTKLLDIYSYFDLLRQFNVFKTCLLSSNNVSVIERTKRINIGEINFMKNIQDCFDNNNFRIFGK